MKTQIGPQDVQNGLAAFTDALEDERTMIPAKYMDGLFVMKQLVAGIASGEVGVDLLRGARERGEVEEAIAPSGANGEGLFDDMGES